VKQPEVEGKSWPAVSGGPYTHGRRRVCAESAALRRGLSHDNAGVGPLISTELARLVAPGAGGVYGGRPGRERGPPLLARGPQPLVGRAAASRAILRTIPEKMILWAG
jgi:hypothetical protein